MINIRLVLVFLMLVLVGAPTALATHDGAWHWSRTVNPIYLNTYDNNNTAVAWGAFDGQVYRNWNQINNYTKFLNKGVSPTVPADAHIYVMDGRNFNFDCGPTGPAGTWDGCGGVLGDPNTLHITSGWVWLERNAYDVLSPRHRQYVKCQELGHTLYLEHLHDNLGGHTSGVSCMSYTNADWYLPTVNDAQALDILYGFHTGELPTPKSPVYRTAQSNGEKPPAGAVIGTPPAPLPFSEQKARFCDGRLVFVLHAATRRPTDPAPQGALVTRLSRPEAIPPMFRCS